MSAMQCIVLADFVPAVHDADVFYFLLFVPCSKKEVTPDFKGCTQGPDLRLWPSHSKERGVRPRSTDPKARRIKLRHKKYRASLVA